tara:strand:- start:2518 stop:2763 length:246 start_codon:yes stop_codon:yes gene_type:complete
MVERFIIIGRSTCHFCTMAEDLLKASKKDFIFLDYAARSNILEDYKHFYNQKTVPIILSNDLNSGLVKKVGGYTNLLEYLA